MDDRVGPVREEALTSDRGRDRSGPRSIAVVVTLIAAISSFLVVALVVTLRSSVRPTFDFLFMAASYEFLTGFLALGVYKLMHQRRSWSPAGALALSALIVCVFQLPALFVLVSATG